MKTPRPSGVCLSLLLPNTPHPRHYRTRGPDSPSVRREDTRVVGQVSTGAICFLVNMSAARPLQGELDAQLPDQCHLLIEKQLFPWGHLLAATAWPLCVPWGDPPCDRPPKPSMRKSGHDLPALLHQPRDQSAACCHGASVRKAGRADHSTGWRSASGPRWLGSPGTLQRRGRGAEPCVSIPEPQTTFPGPGPQCLPEGAYPGALAQLLPAVNTQPQCRGHTGRASDRPFGHVLAHGEATGALREVLC